MKITLTPFFCGLLLWATAAQAHTEPSAKPQPSPLSESERAFSKKSLYQADVDFTTDQGRRMLLGELSGHPVVVAMFFRSCGYACPLIVSNMAAIQANLPEDAKARTLFVLVSFDPSRDTPESLASYRTERGLDSKWILLHGTTDSIRELAALLDVKYKQDPDGGFSHSNVVTVLNRDGEIIHQRNGLKNGLTEITDAIVNAK